MTYNVFGGTLNLALSIYLFSILCPGWTDTKLNWTLNTNLYQNRPSFVADMRKKHFGFLFFLDTI